MKYKHAMVAGLCLVASGCGRNGSEIATGCEPSTVSVPCQNNPNTPEVTINTRHPLKANPQTVCALRGTTIVYKISPRPHQTATVRIVPKEPADTWLAATNDSDPARIRITVPNSAAADTNHDYSIVTQAGECLDPRVRVR